MSMGTVVRASLRVHLRRYVAAAVAVICAVAFVVVTNLVSSATSAGLADGIARTYRGSDVVATGLDVRQATALVDAAPAAHARAAVVATGFDPVGLVQANGQVATLLDGTSVGVVSVDPSTRWQRLDAGRFPRSAGEAVMDRNDARADDVQVGQLLAVGDGSHPVRVRVVGLVDAHGSDAATSLYLTWPDLASLGDADVDAVTWHGPGSTAAQLAQVRRLVHGARGAQVMTTSAHVRKLQIAAAHGVDVLAVLMLFFVAVAVFVSMLVIGNTVSILLTQRLRDFALLRCVGATRKQVQQSVRVEALVLGAGASVAGLVAGLGLGYALLAIVRALSPGLALGAATPSPRWLAGGLVLGVVTTLVASSAPIRRILRVSPLAALRPAEAYAASDPVARWRLVLATVLGVGGLMLLLLAMAAHNAAAMFAGGFATFLAVLAVGPTLVPAVVRCLGGALRPVLGRAGRLAVDNAVRNPRRTATTTAALLVGVTLMTAVLTGIGSGRGAIDRRMDAEHPLDETITATGTSLPATTLDRVRHLRDVGSAVAVAGRTAEIAGYGAIPVMAPIHVGGVIRGSADVVPDSGTIALPSRNGTPPPAHVVVRTGGRAVRLATTTSAGLGQAGIVSTATLASLGGATGTSAVWLRARHGADGDRLRADLHALAQPSGAAVAGGLASREYVDLQLRILTDTVLGLLGVAVLIAVVGIANTLGLSVLERGREHALLRALGLTRGRLRWTLTWEALLLGAAAALIGLSLGLAYAWVGVRVVVDQVAPDSAVLVPWPQLVLVVAGCAAAAVLAAVLPARRASRIAPAAGLQLD